MFTKKKKRILIAVIVLVVAAAVAMMALFIPRTGKKVADYWGAGETFEIDRIRTIEKKSGEKFKILMMTDIQLWTNLGDNAKTFELMDRLVEKTAPDLIVLPGDNVSGLTTDLYTRQLIKKMESYRILWAPVFGNHDSEGNATLEWQADRFEESEYCLFDNGRYTDYGGDIGEDETFMGYGQIAWYEWNVKGIAKHAGRVVPSMSFSHCAQPEFYEAMKKYGIKVGNRYYVPKEMGSGYCRYLPGAAPVNSGFIDKVKELGSTKYVFAGHDHENNASIRYEGITYTYGLKTGWSPRYWNDATEYGGTVVTLDADNAVSIRNEVMVTL